MQFDIFDEQPNNKAQISPSFKPRGEEEKVQTYESIVIP